MEFPIRCVSCGKVIANKCEGYKKNVVDGGANADKYLDSLNLRRQCCRTRFITFPWALRDDLYLYNGAKKSGVAKYS